MSVQGLNIIFIGLSLSSSWGNGHATTFRALIAGLDRQGHHVTFLEHDAPWYAAHRDLPDPDFCRLAFYDGVDGLRRHWADTIAAADAVVVGSYVHEGQDTIDFVFGTARGKVCFYDIDTPVTLAALARGACSYLAARQVLLFDVHFSFSGGPALDILRHGYGARNPRALHCMVDPVRYRPDSGPKRWTMGYLGTYSEDRQPGLEALLLEPARRLPDRAFVVAGPQYPDAIDWPDNVERIEHVPPDRHAEFYGAMDYTLNLTRSDMKALGHSPSVRLFEAAACGTPIVSDRWEGLAEFFPEGEAIALAGDGEDVTRLLTGDPPSERARRAERARSIALAGHTGDHRAREMTGAIRALYRREGPFFAPSIAKGVRDDAQF